MQQSFTEEQVCNALHNSMMSPDKATRDASTSYLVSLSEIPEFFNILFSIITNVTTYSVTQNLHAAIYVTKFIQTEYVRIEKEEFKSILQEAMLKSFLSHQNAKIRNQLRVGILRLIITDFPSSQIFELLISTLNEEKLRAMSIEEISTITTLYYFAFKALYTDKHNNPKLKKQIIESFQLKRPLFIAVIDASFQQLSTFLQHINSTQTPVTEPLIDEILKVVSLSGLRYAIKFLNIENMLSLPMHAEFAPCVQHLHVLQQLTHRFCGLVNLFAQVEEQEKVFQFIHQLRQIAYSYHKYFRQAINEKRTTAAKCVVVLEYLKAAYFNNATNLILNNESFIDTQKLADSKLLTKLSAQPTLVQFFEDECNLVIQSLDICSDLIQVLGFKSVNHLFSNDKSIDETCDDELVITQYFDENYFALVLEFLLKKVLQMNWNSLAMITLEPERAFSEDDGSDICGIRESGVNLLKILITSVNEDKMMDLLNTLLIKFTSSICTGKGAFSEVLEREAFYFIMNGLYKDIKNMVEFEDWYVSVLSTELIIDDRVLNPLKVQILNLVYSYLENSYSQSAEIVQSLFSTIATLMTDSSQSIYIRLMSMKCFIPLMDSNMDLMVNVEQLMSGVCELFADCQENQSKMLLLEFVQNLIDLMTTTTASSPVSSTTQSAMMAPIYEFLRREGQEACDDEDQKQLSLKARISQVLSQILLKQGLEIKQIEFITNVIDCGMKIEEYSEIYLTENACRLMYFFAREINRKISESYPLSMQNMPKKHASDAYTPYEHAVEERNMLISQVGVIESILNGFVAKIERIFLEKQVLYRTSVMILIELINSPFASVAKAIGNALAKGILTNLDEVKDELFGFIFDAIEYLQIVHPITTAGEVEQAALVFISEAVKKNIFNNPMKICLLRIIGRAFFNDLSLGKQLCDKIASHFSEPEFLNNLLIETNSILNQIKPELYFYRMQYSAMLAVIRLLLQLANAEGNAAAITDLKIVSTIDAYSQELEKILTLLKHHYDKSLCSDTHWIVTNLSNLLTVEDILDPSEVQLSRASLIAKHLDADFLMKIDFATHTKTFFTANRIIPSIEINFDKLSLE